MGTFMPVSDKPGCYEFYNFSDYDVPGIDTVSFVLKNLVKNVSDVESKILEVHLEDRSTDGLSFRIKYSFLEVCSFIFDFTVLQNFWVTTTLKFKMDIGDPLPVGYQMHVKYTKLEPLIKSILPHLLFLDSKNEIISLRLDVASSGGDLFDALQSMIIPKNLVRKSMAHVMVGAPYQAAFECFTPIFECFENAKSFVIRGHNPPDGVLNLSGSFQFSINRILEKLYLENNVEIELEAINNLLIFANYVRISRQMEVKPDEFVRLLDLIDNTPEITSGRQFKLTMVMNCEALTEDLLNRTYTPKFERDETANNEKPGTWLRRVVSQGKATNLSIRIYGNTVAVKVTKS